MRSSKVVDDWWAGEYAEDIHNNLRKREKRCMQYSMRSPQLSYRWCLIDYLSVVCDKLELCTAVKHLAAYFLDLFMDSYSVLVEHFQLVILGCVSVAAKVDEQDMIIPRMSELNSFVGNVYSLHEFVSMETFIMEFFNWDLMVPTVATFVSYYSLHAILTSDCYSDLHVKSFAEAETYVLNYVNYFLDMSLHEVTFRLLPSSLVAASCVAAARICLGLSPSWPKELCEITQYTLYDLKGCLELMIRILEMERISVQKRATHDLADKGSCYSSDEISIRSSASSSASSTPATDSGCEFT